MSKVAKSSHTPPDPYMPTPPIVNFPHQNGPLVTREELALIHCYHPESIVCITIHCIIVHCVGLDKCILTYTHHYSITRGIFMALKFLCALPVPPSAPAQFERFENRQNSNIFSVTLIVSTLTNSYPQHAVTTRIIFKANSRHDAISSIRSSISVS